LRVSDVKGLKMVKVSGRTKGSNIIITDIYSQNIIMITGEIFRVRE
jgi:ribosomal protein L14E/L6E/L27E